MYIVPREDTYVFYDTNLPDQLVDEYNTIYLSYYGYESTYEDIMNREALRVTLLLLAFRLDPYMFHQSNVRNFYYNGSTTTLMAHWADSVLNYYVTIYTLPVLSHMQDLLSQKWIDREFRDNCTFVGQVKVNNATREIVGVQGYVGTAGRTCTIGITGANVNTPPAGATVETYGPDTTLWAPVSYTSPLEYVALKTPIPLLPEI